MRATATGKFLLVFRGPKRWAAAALILAAALAAGAATPKPPQPMPPMTPPALAPQRIAMGAFYDGAHVRIDGVAPADAGIVVAIEGSDQGQIFERKGRVGPIWLAVDKIHVKNAPAVFLRYASAPIEALLAGDEIWRYSLDETAIAGHCQMYCRCKCSAMNRTMQSGVNDAVPDSLYAAVLISDFLQIKRHEGSYAVHPSAVQTVSTNGATAYSLDLDWPRSFAPGNYRVTVYACRGHRVVAQSSAVLLVEEIGFPAYMANLAETRPWAYGVVAMLTALLAGFLTDLLTTSLRRRRKPSASGRAQQADSTGQNPPGPLHDAGLAH